MQLYGRNKAILEAVNFNPANNGSGYIPYSKFLLANNFNNSVSDARNNYFHSSSGDTYGTIIYRMHLACSTCKRLVIKMNGYKMNAKKTDALSLRERNEMYPWKEDHTSFLEDLGVSRKFLAGLLMLIAAILICTSTNMYILHLMSSELGFGAKPTDVDISVVVMPMVALLLIFIAISPLLERKMKYLLWLIWGVAMFNDLVYVTVSLVYGG